MTVVHMSEKGQIVVPKEIRDKHGFANGSAFAVQETASGQILLRPVKHKAKSDLLDALRRFKGLEVPKMKFHGKPRI